MSNKIIWYLFSAPALIAFFSLLTRIIGIARQHYLAAFFGVSSFGSLYYDLDIYFAAFRVPDFIFHMLSLWAISSVLIPLFHKNEERIHRLTSSFFNLFGISLIVFTAAAYFSIDTWIQWIAPGFDAAQKETTIEISKILLLSPLLMGLAAILNSYIQARHQFLAFALAPLMYNISVLVAILLFAKQYGIFAPAWGAVVGSGMQLLINVIFAWKEDFQYRPIISEWRTMLEAGKLLIPRVISLMGTQLALTIEIAVASTLGSGMIAAYYFADSLQNLPIALVGISIAIPAFTAMSSLHNKSEEKKSFDTLQRKLFQVLYIIMPITLISFFLAPLIVSTILESGAFGSDETALVSTILQIFALSFPFQAIIPLVSRYYFALQNTLYPLVFTLISIGINIALVYTITDTFSVFGLAIAYIASAITNSMLLILFLKKVSQFHINMKQTLSFFAPLLPLSFLSFSLSILYTSYQHTWISTSLSLGIFSIIILWAYFMLTQKQFKQLF